MIDIGQEEGVNIPAGRDFARLAGGGGLGGEIVEEDGETPDGEPASPEVREVDTVEALEIGLYRVRVLGE